MAATGCGLVACTVGRLAGVAGYGPRTHRADTRRTQSCILLIATTLLDGAQYSAEDVAGLYLQRWTVELFFRDIKTSMGTEMLNGRSPGMVRR